MATSTLMTETSREATLQRVPCIRYLVQFRRRNDEDKDKDIRALINLGSEVNAMHLAYATKFGLRARKIDVGAQKIDGSYLDTFGIVITNCLVKNKLGRVRFFQETFLLANISLEVVLGMPFLMLSKADIWFTEQELVWRSYMAAKTLLTTKRVVIINKEICGGGTERRQHYLCDIYSSSSGANNYANSPLSLGPSHRANK